MPAPGVWTASGAIANVNTLLAGVTFTPAANFNGSFSIATSVSDGVAPAITGSKAFTGTAVNDAPTATNLSAAETYTEDTPLNLIDIVVSDVDSANVTATLTLSNPAAGSLSTATSGAVTSTYNAGTGVWTASGAIADVNALLAGVTFTPAANFNGSFTIATSVSDGVAPAVTGSKAFTGIAVNDAPTATNLSAAETYTEDTPLNLADIVVSDVDSANVTATLTLSNPAAGSLSTATSGAVTSTYNAGTGVWTASGAIADVNALLAGVTFTPAANFNGSFIDRDQRQRRGGAGDHRQQGVHRHRGQRCADGDQLVGGGDLHGGHAAQPGRHRGERCRQRQRDGDADAVEPGGRQPEHGDLGCGDLDLQCGNRGLDRHGGDRRRQHAAGGRDVHAGGELQRQLHDRDQRQRRGGAGDHRQQGGHRDRGERCADGDQLVGGGDLHGGHAAEPDRHRGERRRQRQRDGNADAVEPDGRAA